jgi:hypothetical protein
VYTIPASAWPDSTLVRTSVTLVSSDTGCSVMPRAVASFFVAEPHGTPSAHTTSFLPSSEASRPVIFAGFPFGTISVSTFVANCFGVPAIRDAATALSMFGLSAVASTSTAAPEDSWSISVDEPSKENLTVTPA